LTEAFPPAAYEREDESPDARFYDVPRRVVHIDDGAIAALGRLYADVLPPGGRLLDLMSSWRSHLPAGFRAGEVVVMFPEGTRQTKGLRKKWEARPHTGAARIAHDAGVPLVPAAIKGTDRLARLAPLRVAYGAPVEASEDSRETTERLMAEIRRLYETL